MEAKEIRISLAAARVNAGMTQNDVAKILHINKQTLVNWEKGTTQPKIDQAEKLSNLYEIPYQNLIFLPNKTN